MMRRKKGADHDHGHAPRRPQGTPAAATELSEGPTKAATASDADPIFVAIEAHRQANNDWAAHTIMDYLASGGRTGRIDGVGAPHGALRRIAATA
jgi:hypothetical protein